MSILSAQALALVLLGVLAQAPAPVVTNEATLTITVERVDRFTREVVFQDANRVTQSVYVDPSITAFDDLKAGDVVVVRYIDSVIVQVRPGAKPSAFRDTTEDARKAGAQGVLQQLTMVVTVESFDSEKLVVTYRTHDNRRVVRAVRDKQLLDGVKPGDRVEVTYTRARAVSIAPAR